MEPEVSFKTKHFWSGVEKNENRITVNGTQKGLNKEDKRKKDLLIFCIFTIE